MSVVTAVRYLAEFAAEALRPWDPSREKAAVMLADLPLMVRLREDDSATADEVTYLVLGRFAAAELPTVEGKDYLAPEQVTTVRQRSLPEMIAAAEAEAEKFNAEFPSGTRVEYWRGAREGKGRVSRTEGLAFATRSGTAAVFIVNTSGYIALSHVRPLVAEAVAVLDGCCDDHDTICAVVEDAFQACCPTCPEFAKSVTP